MYRIKYVIPNRDGLHLGITVPNLIAMCFGVRGISHFKYPGGSKFALPRPFTPRYT